MPSPALLAPLMQKRPAAETIPGVTNLYDPDRSDALANRVYNPDGSVVSSQASATSGLFPVESGMQYVFSLQSAHVNWLVNTVGVHFWSDESTHNSLVTVGPVFSADERVVKFTAPLTGFASVSLKYAIGGVFSTSNVIPTDAVSLLLPRIMLNTGSLACAQTAYGDPDTVPAPTAAIPLDDEMLFVRSGAQLFHRFQYNDAYDIVHRVGLTDQSYNNNPNFDFLSWVEVPVAVAPQQTPGSFAENFTPTPTGARTYYIESDNTPPYRINGMFLGGGHGIVSWKLTAAGHGKTNANARGSLWSIGGETYMVTRIIDANTIVVTHEITGTDENWAQVDPGLPASGTLTHVSGASATGSISYSARAQTQLFPNTQNYTAKISKDRGARLNSDDIYPVKSVRANISYQIPNAKGVLDYLATIVGQSNDVFYNSPGLPSQIGVNLEYLTDIYGVTFVRYEVTALQAHYRNSIWATQHQALTHRSGSGETLHFFMEGVEPFEAGETQSGGNERDFANIEDISTNGSIYYADQGTWVDGGYWSDGEQRPPSLWMFGVKDSGDNWIKKYVFCNDDDEGRTSQPGYTTRALLLSTANKAYPYADYNRDIAQGEAEVVLGAFGPVDPNFDTEAVVNFAYHKGGGVYGFRWHTLNGSLTDYVIPVRPELIGKRIRIVKRAAAVTVSDAVVGADGITVSTSGAGGFSAVLY